MHLRPRIALAVGALALSLAACGGGHEGHGAASSAAPSGALQTVAIEMKDIAFTQKTLEIAAGSTVQFEFTNHGAIPHDAFVGDADEQQEHADEMASMASSGMDDHSMHHDALTLAPGEKGTLRHTFDTPGTYEIGCHQPGHYEAGMKVLITVV